MQIRGTLQPKDILAAMWLSVRPRRSFAVMGLVLLGVAVWALVDSLTQANVADHTWPLAIGLSLLVVYCIVMPYFAVRDFRQRKDLQRELKMTPSDDGFQIESANGSMTIPWGDYLGWREGQQGFKLYLSGTSSQYIPKHFFASERDVAGFRELLSSKVAIR